VSLLLATRYPLLAAAAKPPQIYVEDAEQTRLETLRALSTGA